MGGSTCCCVVDDYRLDILVVVAFESIMPSLVVTSLDKNSMRSPGENLNRNAREKEKRLTAIRLNDGTNQGQGRNELAGVIVIDLEKWNRRWSLSTIDTRETF